MTVCLAQIRRRIAGARIKAGVESVPKVTCMQDSNDMLELSTSFHPVHGNGVAIEK
jgi:hypothetical protein